MSSQQFQSEKARLRELVSSFGRRAGEGAPCTYLGRSGECRLAARFHVDRGLRHFWVAEASAKGDMLHPLVALSKVTSVRSLQQESQNSDKLLGGRGLPEEVAKSLSDDDLKRSVLMLHNLKSDADAPSTVGQVLLLEEDPALAKVFVESMKVLVIYATHQRSSEKGA